MRLGLFLLLISIFISLIFGYFTNQPLLGAIIFLFTQFLCGIYIISFKNRRIELIDIRLILYLVLLLYSIFYPVIMLLGLLPFKPTIIPTTILFGTSFLGLNIANILFPITIKSNIKINIEDKKRSRLSIFIHLMLIFSFLLLLTKSGLSLNSKIGELSRSEIFESVSQLWIVLVMLINASSIFNIYHFKNLSNIEKTLFILSTVLYIYVHFQLGNRRDYLPIILATFCFYGIIQNIKINYKVIILVGALFIGSFWITIQRNQRTKEISNDEKIELAIVSNEFIYPMQTLLYTIKDKWDLRYGYTYSVMPFEILIPRTLYPNKPKTLGSEFVSKTFGKGYQGFAYTPTTEAYLNFGFAGPIFIFFVFGYLINRLIKYSFNNKNWLYYLVFYSLVFDFCRGDFPSFMYQIFVINCLIFILQIRNFKLIF